MPFQMPDRDYNLNFDGCWCRVKVEVGWLVARARIVGEDEEAVLTVSRSEQYRREPCSDDVDWSWPDMGLVNHCGAACLVFRSVEGRRYRRGLRSDNIDMTLLLPGGVQGGNIDSLLCFEHVCDLYYPQYPSGVDDAVWLLDTGRAVSVALDCDVAMVCPDDDGSRLYDVRHRIVPAAVYNADTKELLRNDGVSDYIFNKVKAKFS